MLKKVCLVVAVLLLAFSVAAYVASPAAGKDQNAGTKLIRGFTNLVGCWLEVPKQIYLTSKEDNPYVGLTYGLVKGLGYGLYRGAAGIFETVTFVIPPYDKILIDPELVFEGWN